MDSCHQKLPGFIPVGPESQSLVPTTGKQAGISTEKKKKNLRFTNIIVIYYKPHVIKVIETKVFNSP